MKAILLKNIYQVLSYNKWANQRLIGNINKIADEDYYKAHPAPFENIHGILLHLYHYETKFYQKLTTQVHTSVEMKLPRAELAEQVILSSSRWLHWIEQLMQSSRLPKFFAEAAKNVHDLAAHNNYHRGQINTLASIGKAEPESLDVFLYNDCVSKI